MRGHRTATAKAATVEVLREGGLSVREIGQAVDLPKSTVHDILAGHVDWAAIKTLEQFPQQRFDFGYLDPLVMGTIQQGATVRATHAAIKLRDDLNRILGET